MLDSKPDMERVSKYKGGTTEVTQPKGEKSWGEEDEQSLRDYGTMSKGITYG